jgi:hypothetical protein
VFKRLIVLLVVASAGCREMSAPEIATLSGSFVLTEIDGKMLPDTLAVISKPDPTHPCVILRTSGSLMLDPVSGKFSITVNNKSLCSGAEGVLLTESGTYRQDGAVLTMTEPGGVEPFTPVTLQGHIDPQRITVQGFYDYTFAR